MPECGHSLCFCVRGEKNIYSEVCETPNSIVVGIPYVVCTSLENGCRTPNNGPKGNSVSGAEGRSQGLHCISSASHPQLFSVVSLQPSLVRSVERGSPKQDYSTGCSGKIGDFSVATIQTRIWRRRGTQLWLGRKYFRSALLLPRIAAADDVEDYWSNYLRPCDAAILRAVCSYKGRLPYHKLATRADICDGFGGVRVYGRVVA